MKFLIDENLSPQLCHHLASLDDTAEHVHDAVGSGASDDAILAYAAEHDMVIVTADTDFGTLLAHSKAHAPSVILVRELLPLAVERQGALLAANMPELRDILAKGAVVVFTKDDIRVRLLPIG